MPRPSKYNSEAVTNYLSAKRRQVHGDKPPIETLLIMIETGTPIDLACAVAGISRSTFYDWRLDYPDFDEAVNLSLALCAQRLIYGIMTREYRWQALAWILQRRWPDLWTKLQDPVPDADLLDTLLEEENLSGPNPESRTLSPHPPHRRHALLSRSQIDHKSMSISQMRLKAIPTSITRRGRPRTSWPRSPSRASARPARRMT
jgi:hypothetical protein